MKRNYHFFLFIVVIDDTKQKAVPCTIFRKGWDTYVNLPIAVKSRYEGLLLLLAIK